jgi:hypothetical protein
MEDITMDFIKNILSAIYSLVMNILKSTGVIESFDPLFPAE